MARELETVASPSPDEGGQHARYSGTKSTVTAQLAGPETVSGQAETAGRRPKAR